MSGIGRSPARPAGPTSPASAPPTNHLAATSQPLGPSRASFISPAEEALLTPLELFLDEREIACPHDCENEWQHYFNEQTRRLDRTDISIAILTVEERFPAACAHWLLYEPLIFTVLPLPSASSPVPVVDPEVLRRQEMERERERIHQEQAFVAALQRNPHVRLFCRRFDRCLACLLQLERLWRRPSEPCHCPPRLVFVVFDVNMSAGPSLWNGPCAGCEERTRNASAGLWQFMGSQFEDQGRGH